MVTGRGPSIGYSTEEDRMGAIMTWTHWDHWVVACLWTARTISLLRDLLHESHFTVPHWSITCSHPSTHASSHTHTHTHTHSPSMHMYNQVSACSIVAWNNSDQMPTRNKLRHRFYIGSKTDWNSQTITPQEKCYSSKITYRWHKLWSWRWFKHGVYTPATNIAYK